MNRYRSTSAVLVGGILVTFVIHSLSTVTTTSNADWKQASAVIEEYADLNTTVIFDHPRPPPAYRTFFAGRGHYLSSDIAIPSVTDVLRDPHLVEPDDEILISLLGGRPEIPDWTRVAAGDGISLYIAELQHTGRLGAAAALKDFGQRLGVENGSLMTLAAAKLYAYEGMTGQAQSLILDLLQHADDLATKRMLAEMAEEHEVIPRLTD